MARFTEPLITEQQAFGGLSWLTLQAPELSAGVRAGQYLLVRCADAGSFDPLLRRPLFVAGADRTHGTLTLLYAPDERGLAWLARRRPGERLDIYGPLGTPFTLEAGTRNLLLAGSGPGLAALVLAAQEAVARGSAVVLLAGAATPELLPPPFLLPPDVEYQELQIAHSRLEIDSTEDQIALSNLQSAITWADQVLAAFPAPLLPALSAAVRDAKLRWQRGFAQVLLEGPLPCGTGACLACLVETRKGLRTRCKDGPVFDLRDIGL